MIRIYWKYLDKVAKTLGVRPAYVKLMPKGKTFRGAAFNAEHELVGVLYKGRKWKLPGATH